jgi:hypothetical protein
MRLCAAPDDRRGATLENSNLTMRNRSIAMSNPKPYPAVAPIRLDEPKTSSTPRLLNVE